MSFRIWLFLAGISALLAVIAGAYSAHSLGGLNVTSGATKAFEVAQTFHMMHSIALFGLAALLAATDSRRTAWANWMLQIVGFAFLAGIMLFSGGIYYQVLGAVKSGVPLIPAGGISFMIGWTALALSAFGFHGNS